MLEDKINWISGYWEQNNRKSNLFIFHQYPLRVNSSQILAGFIRPCPYTSSHPGEPKSSAVEKIS